MHMQRIAKRPQVMKLCHNHYSFNYLYTRLIYLFIHLFVLVTVLKDIILFKYEYIFMNPSSSAWVTKPCLRCWAYISL